MATAFLGQSHLRLRYDHGFEARNEASMDSRRYRGRPTRGTSRDKRPNHACSIEDEDDDEDDIPSRSSSLP
jgi:hypothetical protein